MEENRSKTEKLSYDKLREVAAQLQHENIQLRRTLEKQNYEAAFTRLNYLFKVMEFPHMFNPDFVNACSREIESIMTVPEESDSQSEVNDTTDHEEA